MGGAKCRTQKGHHNNKKNCISASIRTAFLCAGEKKITKQRTVKEKKNNNFLKNQFVHPSVNYNGRKESRDKCNTLKKTKQNKTRVSVLYV